MADEETNAAVSENTVTDSESRCECDRSIDSAIDVVGVGCSCTEPASCSSEVTVMPSDCLETSASTVPSGETSFSNSHLPVDTASNVAVQSSKCQLMDGCIDTPASPQQTSFSASGQETLSGPAQRMAQETVSAELQLSCRTDSNAVTTAASDVCNSFPKNSHSDGRTIADKHTNNVEEMKNSSVDAAGCLSPITNVEYVSVDQVKPSPAGVSTPEAQSVRCSVVQSSLHSTRQVKCRKTGHRRITANGANLSLGQLINAVSESCLTESLDHTYNIPASSLSSAAEHRMTTPVKAADAADSNVIKEKLFGHFDTESACSTGSPCSTNEACLSPQVVDGVRRPPRARKSCHSNDKVTSDLMKEQSNSPGTPFGSVRLAELVDAQSLDKLDVRTFDEMLLAKMWDRMRPSNGFKLLLHNSEQSQMRGAVSLTSEGDTAEISDNKMQDLGSGTPLIPSTAKKANLNCDSSARTNGVHQQKNQVIYAGAAEVPGQSSRKRVWRCRKSSWSLGNPHRKVNRVIKQPHEGHVTVEGQATRRSPRSLKHRPIWQNVDKVGKCDWLISLIV